MGLLVIFGVLSLRQRHEQASTRDLISGSSGVL